MLMPINKIAFHLCWIKENLSFMKIVYTAIMAIAFLAACIPAKMSVSDELKAGNDEYPVKGRNGILIKQKLSFGQYATTHVKRSWTKGNSSTIGIGRYDRMRQEWVNMISMEYINKKQTIRFGLADGKNQSDVYCVSRFNAEDLSLGRSPNSILNIGMDLGGIGGRSTSHYYVQVYADEKDDRPWEMLIDNQYAQAKPGEYVGYLAKSRDEYFSIVPVTKLELKGRTGNILAGSVGFEFRNKQGQAVAAVSLMDNGMVFLGKLNDTERFLLANACAALLLQEEIE